MKLKDKGKEYLLLEEKNLYGAFLYLALPVMAANLLKSINELVDTYFIGQMQDSVSAQAGMSITWPLLNIFMALSVGLAVAGVAIISQQLGGKDVKKAKEYAGLLFILSFILGIVFNIALLLCAPLVLDWMGATGGTYDAALTYFRVRSFEMVFLFLFTAFQATRQAKGDTLTPVILSMTSIVINIILTGIFINVLQMGVFGAGLATVIGQVAITPAIIYFTFMKKDEMRLTKKELTINRKSLSKLFVIAMPSAASQALSALGFLILQAVILGYGDVVSAAFSIGNKISNLLLIPIMALGSILAAFVGQNIGAGNKERAMQSYKVSRNIALICSIIGCLIIYPIRESFLHLLSNHEETVSVAMEYMFWVLLTQPLMGIFQNYMGVFNGSGNTQYSLIIASARLWILRLPMIMCFKYFTDLGRSGIWYAMVLSNIMVLLIAKVLFQRLDFKSKV